MKRFEFSSAASQLENTQISKSPHPRGRVWRPRPTRAGPDGPMDPIDPRPELPYTEISALKMHWRADVGLGCTHFANAGPAVLLFFRRPSRGGGGAGKGALAAREAERHDSMKASP